MFLKNYLKPGQIIFSPEPIKISAPHTAPLLDGGNRRGVWPILTANNKNLNCQIVKSFIWLIFIYNVFNV